MSTPKTFLDVIAELKEISKGHGDYAASMEALSKDMRYSRQEREMVAMLGDYARRVEERIKGITSDIGSLAVAHSNVPFDDIIKAIGK
jgi:hypothetical protein